MKRGRKPKKSPAILTDGREAGALILRDGSQLRFSRALPEDSNHILAFLERLTKREQSHFVQSLRIKWEDLPHFLDHLSDRNTGGAFLVQRERDEKVLAFGGYKLLAGLRDAAGIALAVSTELRNLGVGTLLIERLAELAARHGVGRLSGFSEGDPKPLISLFRSSGFEPDVRSGRDSTSFLISTRGALKTPGSGRPIRSKIFVASSLRPLFEPGSIAVLGGFTSEANLGHRILWNLVENGFNGPVFPVNPDTEHVLSIRAYPSISEIGQQIDLAIIMTPAETIFEAIESCASAGVQAVIVISAGFSEAGAEGRKKERALLSLVEKHGIRLVGPNCMGIIRTDTNIRLNASFAPIMPPQGTAALCSHSGALGIAITALCRRLGLGLSTFVSVGNRADISANDLLEFWEEDEKTDTILLYLESFGNPRRFARLARRVGRSKPIVTVKAGRSEAGRRAASGASSVVAANTAIDAVLEQTGVISADTLDEMFDIAIALTEQPLPKGRRVAIVTDAGGPAILCVDALERVGMRVEPLSDETQKKLRRLLPLGARTRNPVDMLSLCDPECYRSAVEAVLTAEEVDALVVIYTPIAENRTEEVCEAIASAVSAARTRNGAVDKPVFASIVGSDEIHPILRTKQGERIPVYFFPEAIGRLLGKLASYASWRQSESGIFPEFSDQNLPKVLKLCENILETRDPGWLTFDEVNMVLGDAGLPVVEGALAKTARKARAIADRISYPVVVKLSSVSHPNRVEDGLVVLELPDAEAVTQAFETIQEKSSKTPDGPENEGILVQKYLSNTAEVTIHVQDDPRFGPLVTCGLGGAFVEVLGDVAHRVSPLTDVDARTMIRQLRGFPLLLGFRGYPTADVPAIEDALLRISRLVEAVPHILEIDIGPLFVFGPGDGLAISEARIRIG